MRVPIVAFALAVAFFLLGLGFELPALRLLAKPVPALALAALTLEPPQDRYRRCLAAGLLLSALGDVLLELAPGLFVFGLAAFLLAHLAYIAAFLTDTRRLCVVRGLPVVVLGAAMYLFLLPGLARLAVPVGLYVVAVGAMVWRAAARLGATARGGSAERAGLLGALLFGGSDSLLALDRFHAALPGASYAIMLLYWAGQLGIALSAGRALRVAKLERGLRALIDFPP